MMLNWRKRYAMIFKQFMTPIDGQTEIIEHTENSGIQFTVPFSSIFKIQNSEHNYTLEGLTGSTYVARDYNVVEKVVLKEHLFIKN